jgi:hypothetical protein
MKTTTLILNLSLLAALPVAADEPILRYNLSGGMHPNVEQEIHVGGRIGKFANSCKPSSRAGVACPVIIGPLVMLGFLDTGGTDEGQAI